MRFRDGFFVIPIHPMIYSCLKRLFFIIPAVLVCSGIQAQSQGQGKTILIDFARQFQFLQEKGGVVQKLTGDVQIHQDSVFLYADSATILNDSLVLASGRIIIQQADTAVVFADSLVYNAISREADLFGNVVLVNGEQRLFTDKLHYNLNNKVATYLDGALLTQGETRLRSQRGYYFVSQKEVFFREKVEVTNPEFSLKADTLRFNLENSTAYFLGPTLISTGESQVYTQRGYYKTDTRFAEFYQNSQFSKGNQKASADTIRYDGQFNVFTLQGNAWSEEGSRKATGDLIQYDQESDNFFLKGNAFFQDSLQEIQAEEIAYDGTKKTYTTRGRSKISESPMILEADAVDFDEALGMGIATGNVIWRDTSAQLAIVCDTVAIQRETGYLKAYGGKKGRPWLESIMEEDTLFLSADTLISLMVPKDSLNADSSRILLAFRDVRIFKSDLQAVCDSLSYQTADSTFTLFNSPFLWSDTTQFSSDTIKVTLKEQRIHQILLSNQAFIINSPDEKFFNQIKGRTITASFEEGEMRVADVNGNAQSVYYARDDAGAYIGVNKTECSDMVMYFADNQIQRIKFLAEPKSKMDPMRQADHETMKMEGFNWDAIKPCRPLGFEALFTPPCASRNTQPKARPEAPRVDGTPRASSRPVRQ